MARLLLSMITLLLSASTAQAMGIGTWSRIECEKSCKFTCKSPYVGRVIEFDGHAETTKVFSAFIGSSEITVLDTIKNEMVSPPSELHYVCTEFP